MSAATTVRSIQTQLALCPCSASHSKIPAEWQASYIAIPKSDTLTQLGEATMAISVRCKSREISALAHNDL